MDVYVSDISALPALSGFELLTEARRAQVLRYRRREDRARCLVAGLMLRRVLGPTQASDVIRTPWGKPYLPHGPHFNLSHSGDKVVLLVDESPSGVDVEQVLPYSPAVARRVFTPREQAWLRATATDAAFYRLWTGKESIMKALGMGLRLPPEDFEILPDGSGPNLVLGHRWYLKWRELEGHVLCCATPRPEAEPRLHPLSHEELLR